MGQDLRTMSTYILVLKLYYFNLCSRPIMAIVAVRPVVTGRIGHDEPYPYHGSIAKIMMRNIENGFRL